MAEHWNNPEHRNEFFANVEGERNLRPQPKRRRLGKKMTWWFVVFGLVLLGGWFFAAYGPYSGSTGDAIRGYVNTNADTVGDGNSGNPSPIRHIGESSLTANVPQLLADPKQFKDHSVIVPQAVIQQRLNENVVIVSSAENSNQANGSIAVTVPANVVPEKLQQGTPVRIAGTLTPIPPGELDLGLTSTQAEKIERQGFYLRASAVMPLPQNTHR